MDLNAHLTPHKLEFYSFWWNEVRLGVAAVSLIYGGVPVIWYILPAYSFYSLIHLGLVLAWLISGLAAGYMLYRWNMADRKVFGGKKDKDVAAFFISVVSGLNLGVRV